MSHRIGLLVGLAACTTVQISEISGSLLQCSPTFCGVNSPEIEHYGLYNLDLLHSPNAQGFVLLGASLDRRFYDLEVRNSAIRLRDARGNAITGRDLTGAKIWLQRGQSQYGVMIDGVGTFKEVVPPNDAVETYVLDWSDVVGGPLGGVVRAGELAEEPDLAPQTNHVCPTVVPYLAADGEWDESFYMAPFHSIVFEGDVIHDITRTVEPRPNDRWFNIGCSRHTLAKMRLTRNTIHTVANGDWRQVQATLKMLSADYCGTGTAFTVAGTPIVWRNQVGMSYMSQPSSSALEARWDENGAICLDVPRLVVHPDAGFPTLNRSIYDECKPTPRGVRSNCNDPDPLAWHGELITTANH